MQRIGMTDEQANTLPENNQPGAELPSRPQAKAKSPLARELSKFGIYTLIAYIVIGIIMYTPLYTMIVLRPDTKPSELYKIDKILDAPRQEVAFESGGKKLYGWFFEKPNSKVLVIIHHGNAGNILNRLFLAKAFIESGASVFLYDYRGYGKSEGSISLPGILEDGLVAYDFATKDSKYPVVINYGESIGSGVACHVDKNRKASGLILQSGVASLPNVAKGSVSWLHAYPDFIWPQPQFDNRLLVAQSTTPLLILHGDKDTMVAPQNADMLLAAAAAGQKQLVHLPNCGHNDVGQQDHELFQKSISDFVGARI